MSRFAGAVLTGGASRRMGRDKALVPVEGVPLARRVAVVLEAAGVMPVVAIGGDADSLGAAGMTVIADRWPGEGPLGGLLTAMRWSPAVRLVAVACDLPALDQATVAALLVLDDPDAHVVMAVTDRLQPLCAAWNVDHAAPELQAAFDAGERSIRHAVRGLRIRRVEVPWAPLADADEPADLPPGAGDAPR